MKVSSQTAIHYWISYFRKSFLSSFRKNIPSFLPAQKDRVFWRHLHEDSFACMYIGFEWLCTKPLYHQLYDFVKFYSDSREPAPEKAKAR